MPRIIMGFDSQILGFPEFPGSIRNESMDLTQPLV